MARAKRKTIDQVKELEGEDLLGEMLGSLKATDKASQPRAKDLLRNFIDEVLQDETVASKGVIRAINDRIAAIDELLSTQLDEIMHHEDFQRLEGSWRGLNRLVMNSETGDGLKIRVLNVAKKDLLRDFQSAAEFTESALWKKIYSEEYGTWGGDPYGALVGDYEFSKSTPDIELLTRMSEVAHAAHAPFISAADPKMFGFESFTQLPDPRDLAKIFDKSNPENIKWLAFRDSEDARATSLVLPHTLQRPPYDPVENPIEDFNYRENIDHHDDYCWGNAAYDFAGRLTDAHAKYGWCVAIRGPEGGGMVENLPTHVFKTREGDSASKCPTEITIPEDRENELANLGFLGLVNCKNTDKAAFFGSSSCRKPKKYNKAEATASERLSCQIQYTMATSRIAHYLKCMCRDKIGSFMSREEAETFLNNWIQDYVLAQDTGDAHLKAERPLREAKIVVRDDKSKPGVYRAEAFLKPHFQLDEISVALKLVAEIPDAKG